MGRDKKKRKERNPWTQEDVHEARALKKKGFSAKSIATKLGKSVSSVYSNKYVIEFEEAEKLRFSPRKNTTQGGYHNSTTSSQSSDGGSLWFKIMLGGAILAFALSYGM